MMANPTVFQLADGSFVDPNGNPVKKDGTPLKAASTTTDATQTARVTELEGQVQTLTTERDALQTRVSELEAGDAAVIPADALARLEAVNGISKALAEKALNALKD